MEKNSSFPGSAFFQCVGIIVLSWGALMLPASGEENDTNNVHNVAPAPPSNLSVKQASASGSNDADPSHVNITWDASPSGSPDSYSVEHNQSSSIWGGIYSGSSLSTQDQNLLGNARHFYRVRAHNQFGWSGYTQIAVYNFGVSADLEVQSWSGGDDKHGFFKAFVSANPDDMEKNNIFKYYSLSLSSSDDGINSYINEYDYEYGSIITSKSDSVDTSTDARIIATTVTGSMSYKFNFGTEFGDGYQGNQDPLTGLWTITDLEGNSVFIGQTPWKPWSDYYSKMTWQSIPDTESTSEKNGSVDFGNGPIYFRSKTTLSSEYTTSQMIQKAWANASTSQPYTNYYYLNLANYTLDTNTEYSVSLTKSTYHFKAPHNAILREDWSEVTTYGDPQTQPTTNAISWSTDNGKISGDYSVTPPEINCSISIQYNSETSLSLYDSFGTLDALEMEKDAVGVTSFYVGPDGTPRHVSLTGTGFTVQHQTTGGSMETVSGSVSLATNDSGYFTIAPNSQALSDPKSRLNITAEAFDANNKSMKQKNASVVFVPVLLKQKNYPTTSGSTDLGPTQEKIITKGDNDSSIAYITGEPVMPQLEASLGDGLVSGMSIDWRLEIKTERSERSTQDDTNYPASGYTNLPSNQPWEIGAAFGEDFVGGKCTLFYKINGGVEQTYTFKIRGKNPQPQNAYSYINSEPGGTSQFYYAWGIAKHESAQDPYTYCQFNASGSTKELPNYSASGHDNGWGIFQRDDTGEGIYVSTGQVYSWKINSDVAVQQELVQKLTGVQGYLQNLQNANPTQYAEDPPPTYTTGNGTVLSAKDTLTIETYNGAGLYTALLKFSPSNPSGHRWVWGKNGKLPNAPGDKEPYVDRIAERMKTSP